MAAPSQSHEGLCNSVHHQSANFQTLLSITDASHVQTAAATPGVALSSIHSLGGDVQVSEDDVPVGSAPVISSLDNPDVTQGDVNEDVPHITSATTEATASVSEATEAELTAASVRKEDGVIYTAAATRGVGQLSSAPNERTFAQKLDAIEADLMTHHIAKGTEERTKEPCAPY